MHGIAGCDPPQSYSDGVEQIRFGARFGAAQVFFDFAPHVFNWIEIGRVGRKKKDLGADLGDQGQGGLALVGREVVQNEDVAKPQRGQENTAHVSTKHIGVCGAIDGHAGGKAIQPDGADHGGGLPMTLWHLALDTHPARGAPTQTGHVGFGPRFI